jgi:hypothetical protein
MFGNTNRPCRSDRRGGARKCYAALCFGRFAGDLGGLARLIVFGMTDLIFFRVAGELVRRFTRKTASKLVGYTGYFLWNLKNEAKTLSFPRNTG